MKASFRRVLEAACGLIAVSGVVPALAAEEPALGIDVESSADADQLVDEGIALRRAGQDVEALKAFRRAEALTPRSTRVQVHLAATHQALGEWEEADRYLTRALEQREDSYIQRHQSTLAAARRRIDAQMGSLEVLGGPPGTEVRLNGRLVSTLPSSEIIRVSGGIYTLEARLDGHYPITRSVALAGGALVRESLRLEPMATTSRASATVEDQGASQSEARWLTWTFAGLTVAAGTATAFAWTNRENHAENWNDDDRCLRAGQTREQVCGDELDDGEQAETWMWIGTAAAGTFAAATVVSYMLQINTEPSPTTAQGLECGIGLGQVHCAGRF